VRVSRDPRPSPGGSTYSPAVTWTIRFYRDLDTRRQPAREWMEELRTHDPEKHLAAIAAIERVLKVHGTDVCATEWGKNLGKGLYEFRVRHPASSIRSMFPRLTDEQITTPTGRESSRILLRVFFTTYGSEVVLLCSGYDKGRDPSAKRQRAEIAKARTMADRAHAGLRARQQDAP
jgi:hypothetical protein